MAHTPPGPHGVTGGPIKTLYDGTAPLSKIEGLSLPAPSRPCPHAFAPPCRARPHRRTLPALNEGLTRSPMAPTRRVTVAVVDDHDVVLSGVRAWIDGDPRPIEIVDTATSIDGLDPRL